MLGHMLAKETTCKSTSFLIRWWWSESSSSCSIKPPEGPSQQWEKRVACTQPTSFLGRQYQLQPTIAARDSGDRKLPSQGAGNLPRVEDLVVARWSSVILVDDWMQVHNLFANRFCFGPLAIQGANGQDNSQKQITKNHWLTKRPRLSNSSKSGRIAIKQATHLRTVGLWPIDRTINHMIGQTQAQVQAPPLRSELVRGLDKGLEVWNWPKTRSQPRRPYRFRRFKRLI